MQGRVQNTQPVSTTKKLQMSLKELPVESLLYHYTERMNEADIVNSTMQLFSKKVIFRYPILNVAQ